MSRRAPDKPTFVVEDDETAVDDETKSVKIRAKYNRMRNPHTGAIFTVNKVTDVIALDSDDNNWTRAQLAAELLEIVIKK